MSTEDKKMTLRLSEKLYQRIKQLADSLGHSVTEEINLRLEASTSKDETVESIITQIDALFLSLKRLLKTNDQSISAKKDITLLNLISSLDNDKKRMVLKLIQSIK